MSTFINVFTYVVNPNSGFPLSHGKLYFGRPFDDPLTEPIDVFLAGTDEKIPQPVRTNLAGVVEYQGEPVQIEFKIANYNVRIEDEDGNLLFIGVDSNVSLENEVFHELVGNITQVGYPPYENNIRYGIGSRVQFENRIYEAIQDDPQNPPSNVDDWELADFNTLLNSLEFNTNSIGEIAEFSVHSLPMGWILLNGQRVINGVNIHPQMVINGVSQSGVVRVEGDDIIVDNVIDSDGATGALGGTGRGDGFFLKNENLGGVGNPNPTVYRNHDIGQHRHELQPYARDTAMIRTEPDAQRIFWISLGDRIEETETGNMIERSRVSVEVVPNHYDVRLAVYAGIPQ